MLDRYRLDEGRQAGHQGSADSSLVARRVA
jgi:hypothetical protein